MLTCAHCGQALPDESRYCTRCGERVEDGSRPRTTIPEEHIGPDRDQESRGQEQLNLRILYLMVGLLVLALLFPPWESPPGQPPEYLGMHFILNPPSPDAVVSRMLLTIELVTIAVGGLYLSWLLRFRRK